MPLEDPLRWPLLWRESGDVEMGETKGGEAGFERVRSAVEKVCREGYSAHQVLLQVRSLICNPSRARHDPRLGSPFARF